jgi:ABC-type oligopeptide transport system ATPase subunit
MIPVVGGSGSGKSTLGRVIAGLLAPTSGAVRLEGDARGRVEDGAVVEAGVTLEVLGAPRHAATRVLVG